MKGLLHILSILLISVPAFAQTGSTGIGTTNPHASSILDISSNNKGVLLPRISSSQRKSIAAPAAGLLVYDTDKRTIFLFDGSQWLPMMVATSGTNTIPEMIVPNNMQGEEHVGYSVGISGNYAIFGAPDYNQEQGAAYIYFKQNGEWTQQAKLLASDGAIEDRFGWAVAISGDWAVVGAWGDDILSITPFIINHVDRGSIYIFQRNGTNWTQTAKFTSTTAASTIAYGVSLAMDGDRLIVGSYWDDDNGAAYIYQRSGSLWVLQQRIVATDGTSGDQFGASVDMHGNYAIVGANAEDIGANTNVGAAYIFFHNGTTWTQQQKLAAIQDPQDTWGSSVAISDSLALIGNSTAPVTVAGVTLFNHGEVNAYRRNGTNWSQILTLPVPDSDEGSRIGWAVAIHGELALVCAGSGFGTIPNQGTVYVYKYIDRNWRFQHKINDPQGLNGGFGRALATDGVHIVIGSPFRLTNKGSVAIVNCE